MPCKRCSWGDKCNSDSRYVGSPKRPDLDGVTFHRFPKPILDDPFHPNTVKCMEWIKACGRPDYQLNIKRIANDYVKDNRCFHICSKHFLDGVPTTENPNPFYADPIKGTVRPPKKRNSPKDRSNPPPSKRKKGKNRHEVDNRLDTSGTVSAEKQYSAAEDRSEEQEQSIEERPETMRDGSEVMTAQSDGADEITDTTLQQADTSNIGSTDFKEKGIQICPGAADKSTQMTVSFVEKATQVMPVPLDNVSFIPVCQSTPIKVKPPNNQQTPVKVRLARKIRARMQKKSPPVTYSFQSKESKKRQRENFKAEIMKSDKSCFHYTGFPTVALLKDTFDWLEPSAKCIKLWDGKKQKPHPDYKGKVRKAMSLFDEFLLTLVRIRRGHDTEHLGFLFGVSKSQVIRVFLAWVPFLYQCLGPLLKWPSRALVEGNLPHTFRAYPRTRVVIDCTEFHVEKPFRPHAQRLTWSSYKQNNTFKLLVGITPTGVITFLSDLYSGSISDVAIVEKSGFCERLEPGDDVMADRGFHIRRLLLAKRATLNIPAFSHGRPLSGKALKESRKIATVRIHVERVMRRIKTFRLLSGVIPIKLRFYLHQITTIVAVLSNLQKPLA